MTPKEKAEELVDKFANKVGGDGYTLSVRAKQCALIAVDLLLKNIKNIKNGECSVKYNYYKKVKQEIENL